MEYELVVSVEIRQKQGGGCYGGLSVNESVNVNANGFLEVAAILGKFHSLAESLATKDLKHKA